MEAEDVAIARDHLMSLHWVSGPDDQLGRGSAESVSRQGEAGMKRPGGDIIRMEDVGILNEWMKADMLLCKSLIYLSDGSL